MKNPKISVVLPSYNGEKFIAESIQSVINQTFKDWELIIVNDYSQDKTKEIADYFAAKDPRITVVNNEHNKKLPASLNIGFSHAKGQYLTWTSDDNIYKPNALEKMCEYLESHPDTDMIAMNMDVIDENGNFLYDFSKGFEYKRNTPYLLNACNVGAAFMYLRTIADKVGEYDVNTFCAEDYDYWCRIALAGKIDYTDDNIYQYRAQSASLSATKREQVKEKTLNIKKKYAECFFEKFNFNEKDKAIFYLSISKHNYPASYKKYCRIIKLKRFMAKLVSEFIFWNKKKRKDFRKKLYNRICTYFFPKDENTENRYLKTEIYLLPV